MIVSDKRPLLALDGVRKTTGLSGILLGIWLAAAPIASAQALRSQTVDLQRGWNAVYLEIDPRESDPNVLFFGLPVDVVAAHTSSRQGAQFSANASSDIQKAYGWAVWYAPDRPDAFLTTLYAVHGARAYLIHALADTTLTVSGTTPPERLVWAPDAYNLVGFAVQDPGGPTFAQFFEGSPAHRHSKIYRMSKGAWRLITDPAATPMRSGEAFWIYCQGHSDYPGPLQVETSSAEGLILSLERGGDIVFRNRTTHPVTFHLEHTADPENPLALSAPIRAVNEEGGLQTLHVHFEAEDWSQDFPPLEAGRALRLPLRLRELSTAPRYAMLKAVSDLGTIHYIPVAAIREERP